METEGLSSCTQKPTAGFYPKPVASISHPHTLLLGRKFILSSHLPLNVPSGLFP